jgi:hypothetical protein
MVDDNGRMRRGPARMTYSHVLLHCSNERPRAARAEAPEVNDLEGARVLLSNPRRVWRFVKLLGRVRADGAHDVGAGAAKMDE